MQGFVMVAAQRHGEFVADFASQSSRLGEADVMGIAGCSPADQAPLGSDKGQMILVAASHWLADRGDGIRS